MNTDLTFDRSGTGPACRRAGRVPSLPMHSIHPPRQAAIPDGGRSPSGFLPFSAPTLQASFLHEGQYYHKRHIIQIKD